MKTRRGTHATAGREGRSARLSPQISAAAARAATAPPRARAATYLHDAVMADIRAGRVAQRVRKYRNQPCEFDGMRFDSKAEAKRWQMLKLLEWAGGIRSLMRQVPFPLKVEGQLIATMRPDFSYVEKGRLIADDTKGAKATADWLLKAKLLRALYPHVELRINGVRMP